MTGIHCMLESHVTSILCVASITLNWDWRLANSFMIACKIPQNHVLVYEAWT